MGQVCSFCSDPASAERSKKNAFVDRDGKGLSQYHYSEVDKADTLTTDIDSNTRLGDSATAKSDSALGTSSSLLADEERQRQAQIDEAERRRVVLEEQARLEQIVSTAGREMMTANRRDGYYDPGYAAAVAQNILKGGLPDIDNSMNVCLGGIVPSTTSVVDPTEVLHVLSRGRWEGIMLGQKGGLGGCGGEDPNFFFDDCAEGFLAAMLPTKKHFHESEPIVENLP